MSKKKLLFESVEKKNFDLFQKRLRNVLEKGFDINERERGEFGSHTLLTLCCENNLIEFVKILLKDDKIDVNKDPLLYGCYGNHFELVQELLLHPDIKVEVYHFKHTSDKRIKALLKNYEKHHVGRNYSENRSKYFDDEDEEEEEEKKNRQFQLLKKKKKEEEDDEMKKKLEEEKKMRKLNLERKKKKEEMMRKKKLEADIMKKKIEEEVEKKLREEREKFKSEKAKLKVRYKKDLEKERKKVEQQQNVPLGEEKVEEFLKKKKEKMLRSRALKEKGKLKAYIVGLNGDGLLFAYSDGLRMSNELNKMGYKCTEELYKGNEERPLTAGRMKKSFRRFARSLEDDDKVVFYFSGHGFQHEGKNYLMCAKEDEDDEVVDRLVELNFFITELRKNKDTKNIFFLDCCQEDPKNKTWKGGGGMMNPIESINVKGGKFVFGFACLPGLRTEEKGGGVFTKSLLKVLSKEEEILTILRKANVEMYKTEEAQGSVFFTGAVEDLYL